MKEKTSVLIDGGFLMRSDIEEENSAFLTTDRA